jgi:Fanconi anemia group M protein
MSNTIELKIDFRERTKFHQECLKKLPDNMLLHYTQLTVGDYIIGNRVIIERKTSEDFLASLRDGRIFRQAYGLYAVKMPCIFIVEGNPEVLKRSGLSRHALLGLMVHLSAILGIPVIETENYSETLYIIETLARQMDSIKDRKPDIFRKGKHIKACSQSDRIRIGMLRSIPNLGTSKAEALLKEFGSIKNIAMAEKMNLITTRGIGRKLSQQITEVMQGGGAH